MPRVAIVYLTYYDEPHYLDAASLSVAEQSYPRNDLAFVVVDNSCHGPSAKYVREHILSRSGRDLPETILIENDENVGFAEGNNQGIRWAMERGFDYVFLLNNDAKLDSRAIEEAVKTAESDEKIGAVQSFLLLWQKPELVNSSGNDLHFLGFGITRDYGRPRKEITRQDGEEIAFASGAAVLYRVNTLRHVGLLESFYWMYHEDVELGWRLKLAGYKSVFAARSIVYHDYSFSRSTQKMFWMERNRLLTHLALLRPRSILVLAPSALFMELAVLTGALRGGWFGKKLASYGALLRPSTLRWLRRKREEINDLRRIGDGEATSVFVPRIDHQEVNNPLLRFFLNPILHLYWKLAKCLLQDPLL
ncbi:MAG: Glycosyl transferase family 2 [Candidatus Uhrbacteria bacterium GW2011_GWC2_53_7]|uniref:Glycosyl transferase family 2 n=1 Tax=Candidatus Uhrbacteria bacterium GW2011_GWC2_53_7 TaxID=1618986 RepID=A0A0G2A7Z6_9BACT|nr:MAG: Glycosyl transferase family 2 [Parcubacteria group bacterium GW2011_GWA2_53_21]KKW37052.1 MAG: Glycosyl transferase family 2 [Candidatus Uhrbacteria bacterium GW2011_GWC2_53_7]